MFGAKNIITGEINHDFASLCRYDNTKCSMDGKYFKEKINKNK